MMQSQLQLVGMAYPVSACSPLAPWHWRVGDPDSGGRAKSFNVGYCLGVSNSLQLVSIVKVAEYCGTKVLWLQ